MRFQCYNTFCNYKDYNPDYPNRASNPKSQFFFSLKNISCSTQEKQALLGKNKSKKSRKNQGSNGDSLLKDDVPWHFFTFGTTATGTVT